MHVISFSCPVALARACSTMENRNFESEHLCLVCDFNGKAFSLALLSIVSCGFVPEVLCHLHVCACVHTCTQAHTHTVAS